MVELVVVILIIGIASAVAIPSVLSWLPDIRLNSAARDLYGAIMQAKVEAAKRNSKCTLVFNQIIGGSTYAYVLFEDAEDNSTPSREADYDAGENIITRLETWPKGVSLDLAKGGGDGFTFLNNDDGLASISFRLTSLPTDNDGGGANGAVFLENTNGKHKSVEVGPSGNVRTTNY